MGGTAEGTPASDRVRVPLPSHTAARPRETLLVRKPDQEPQPAGTSRASPQGPLNATDQPQRLPGVSSRHIWGVQSLVGEWAGCGRLVDGSVVAASAPTRWRRPYSNWSGDAVVTSVGRRVCRWGWSAGSSASIEWFHAAAYASAGCWWTRGSSQMTNPKT